MWKSKYSVTLTLTLTYVIAALLVMFIAAGKWIFYSWYGEELGLCVTVTFYCGSVPAIAAIVSLLRLLYGIRGGKVFTAGNIRHLRILSWCCFIVAVICLAASYFYLPLLLITVGAAFMGLILRVIKNVFVAAYELKNENDLTI